MLFSSALVFLFSYFLSDYFFHLHYHLQILHFIPNVSLVPDIILESFNNSYVCCFWASSPSQYMSLIVFVWWPKPLTSFWSVSWYILSCCICLITSSNTASTRMSCFCHILLWPAQIHERPVQSAPTYHAKLQPLHTSILLAQRQDKLIYMWHCMGHPALWVCHCHGALVCMAILGNFVMGILWMCRVQSTSSYLVMLHH